MAATNDDRNTERHQKWYEPDLDEVNPQIRHLLENYSKISPLHVVNHVNEIVSRRNPGICISSLTTVSVPKDSPPTHTLALEATAFSTLPF